MLLSFSQKLCSKIALEIVELYPYVEYVKYLLSGSVTLAMYMAVMIGGGTLYIDDKARGVHEGYLVTPIRGWKWSSAKARGSDQGDALRRIAHCDWLAICGTRSDFSSDDNPATCFADRSHLDCLQWNDVSDDGSPDFHNG